MTFVLTPLLSDEKWLRANVEPLHSPVECPFTHQQPTWVYSLLSDADFLYIGYTSNLAKRLTNHRSQKPWWNDVEKITADLMCCLRHAREAEAYNIGFRRPTYNSMFPEHGRQFACDWVRVGCVSFECDSF